VRERSERKRESVSERELEREDVPVIGGAAAGCVCVRGRERERDQRERESVSEREIREKEGECE
jgi:hypothetical protein